ncbi:MAG: acetolactate synthase large subunit [Candidatus Gracilibacteria bacterium]|nr:acetolactate synthase large subunit [Candidatus Gracilibacteria bacterium]
MKTSDLFIKILEQKGVKTIYGVPGEENLDLLESIGKSNIELVITRNEQTAVFMAATYGRFTGEPGVALATLGPGATNMMTGVAYAQLGGMPLIVITGQKPQNQSKQGAFQIIDVVSMMKPVTKLSMSIVNGSRVPYILENAFKTATSEKPGAVCLELPEDIAGEEVAEEYAIVDLKTKKQRRPVIDRKGVSILIEELEKAKSPIILIGSGANRKRVSKYLTQFIEKYNVPFFSSQMGKGVVDENLPQCLGTAALTSGDYIHDAIAKSDLILSIGYDNVEKPTDILGINGIPVININFVESHYDYVYSPYFDLIGDIGNLFWHLCDEKIDETWEYDDIYKINRENQKNIINNILKEVDFPYMMPRGLVQDLQKTLNNKDILTLDNGLYKVWIARNYKASYANTVLLDNALATMGAGYASAMEAKRLNPDQNVVCVTGDGGLVMNLGDLETAVRLKLDITIVVLNNASYGMIKWKQKNAGFSDFGLDFNNPDFVQLAESFGAKGYKVEKKEDFKPLLQKTFTQPGIKIIDLDFDYPENGEIL